MEARKERLVAWTDCRCLGNPFLCLVSIFGSICCSISAIILDIIFISWFSNNMGLYELGYVASLPSLRISIILATLASCHSGCLCKLLLYSVSKIGVMSGASCL
ncbi:hypothetical protein XENTR_v10020429 [Xenopus tropicalis]|nr:hypothetical protein XENTR_v10020429 [Xenopus tropicalis]